MEELLSKISEDTGVPTDLLERAAQARAAARGVGTDVIVSEWTGEPIPEAAAATPAPAPPPATPVAPAPEPETPPGPSVEVLEPTAEPPAPSDTDEADEEPELILAGFPRWLSTAFVLIPLLAVSYALMAPNGPNCGTSGALAIDQVTGEGVNCDGTPYGVDIINFFTLGEALYEAKCVACHGSQGQGGTGPALAGGSVVVTFPTCDEHVEWVRVGTDGWTELTGRTAYGATETAVGSSGAKMPGFGSLTDSELREVVLYERVAFGRAIYGDTQMACGLDDPTLAAG